ncbi:MAG: copper chaperone PCu(A)C [Microthrixaceae bacterium]|nr:copper chaperone PCu(A)C [Microthrixaceae bacterium]
MRGNPRPGTLPEEKEKKTMRLNPIAKRAAFAASALVLAAGPLAACGSDDDASDDGTSTEESASAVTVSNAWARPGTAGGNSAIYMDLTGGDRDDALVGATISSDVVETVEIHETVMADDAGDMDGSGDMDGMDDSSDTDGMDDSSDTDGMDDSGDMDDHGSGMMTMQPVESIEVPAGETVALEPGGYHVMLIGLVEDLEVGDTVEVTLEFESGETQAVTAEVKEA